MFPLVKHFKTKYFEYRLIDISDKVGWQLKARTRKGITKFKCKSEYFGYPVISLNQAFMNYKLKSIDLSEMDTSNIIDTREAFHRASIKQGIDLHMLDFRKLIYAAYMFSDSHIPVINFSNLKLPNLDDTYKMFFWVHDLVDLNLEGTVTDEIEDANFMFIWCNTLRTLDIRGFKFSVNNYTKNILGFESQTYLELILLSDKILADKLKTDYGFIIMDMGDKKVDIKIIKQKLMLLGYSRVCILCNTI